MIQIQRPEQFTSAVMRAGRERQFVCRYEPSVYEVTNRDWGMDGRLVDLLLILRTMADERDHIEREFIYDEAEQAAGPYRPGYTEFIAARIGARTTEHRTQQSAEQGAAQ